MALGADRDRLYNQCGLPIAANDLKWEFCKTNSLQASNYAVLGDSKAEALFYGLAREIQFANGILIGSILPPDPDQTATHPSEKEQLAHASVLHNPAIKVVIYVKALRTLFKIDDETGFIKAAGIHKVDDLLARYSTAIKQLHQAGKRVIFVVDNPTLPDPLSCVSGGMTSNALLNRIFIRKPNARCHLDYRQHLQGTQDYRAFIQSLQALHPELVVYDPTPLLCGLTHNEAPLS